MVSSAFLISNPKRSISASVWFWAPRTKSSASSATTKKTDLASNVWIGPGVSRPLRSRFVRPRPDRSRPDRTRPDRSRPTSPVSTSLQSGCLLPLGQQHRRAGRAARGQGLVGAGGVMQRKPLVYLNAQIALGHQIKQIFGGSSKFLLCTHIIRQRGARKIKRTFCREDTQVDPIDRSRCIAIADHQSAWLKTIQRGLPGAFSHTIVNHRYLLTRGQLHDALGDILARIVDNFPGP